MAITGLGGLFIEVENMDYTKNWYLNNLGIDTETYGIIFDPKEKNNGNGQIVFNFFTKGEPYLQPTTAPFMVNFRVADLDTFILQLKEKNVTILDEIQEFEYGKFLHIQDCNGMKIELWEPNDTE